MKIVIVGDGKVGCTLTERLSKEGHDIVVIDNNRQVLRESAEIFDVMAVHGNGASLRVQKAADVQRPADRGGVGGRAEPALLHHRAQARLQAHDRADAQPGIC